MKLPASFAALNWRPIAGLFLAGLLGWFLAWFMLPSGAPAAPAADSGAVKDKRSAAQPPAPGLSATGAAPQSESLEQLLKKQSTVSEDAARSVFRPGSPQLGSSGAQAPVNTRPEQPSAAVEAKRAARMKAMLELQSKAIAEIQAVPPGDTKRMMAAMERFDAQMRAAGAPSIIDMDNLRKTLEGTNRMQELSRQLVAESEKGRAADVARVQSLNQEIQALQKSLPRQFIKTDVLQKQMVP